MDARTRHSGTATARRPRRSLFDALFHRLLDRIDTGLEVGAIEASLPDGTHRLLGGRAAGPVAIVDLRRWRALVRLATGGSAGWYEAWAAGDWASPDPVPLFELFMRNRVALGQSARAKSWSKGARRLRHWLRRNTLTRSRSNIAYHYDLGNDFYEAWLDRSMTYSSALFAGSDIALEAAQAAKIAAALDRLDVRAGDSILEIGCGWGSLAEAALRRGARVHGITLSVQQRDFAEARIATAGLSGGRFTLTDYRDVAGTYDGVVSIEMAEAVGIDYWPAYLAAISAALRPGGRAALQLITIDDAIFERYAANVDFIQAHVFPGGALIGETRFRAIAERSGLAWRDRHAFGLDYAETLRHWRDRFDAAVAEGRLPVKFDRNFIDLWRYYLMYCEGGFRGGGIDVIQVTLVKEGA